jgi:hypothetical protein
MSNELGSDKENVVDEKTEKKGASGYVDNT